jgi:hypothetical protein
MKTVAWIMYLGGLAVAGVLWSHHLAAQTQITPDQIRGTRVVSLMTCTKPPTPPTPALDPMGNPILDAAGNPVMIPGSNCAGLYYIELTRPDGTTLKLVGSPAPLNLDPASWSVVP